MRTAFRTAASKTRTSTCKLLCSPNTLIVLVHAFGHGSIRVWGLVIPVAWGCGIGEPLGWRSDGYSSWRVVRSCAHRHSLRGSIVVAPWRVQGVVVRN